jgi:hypothetical protein
MLCLAVNLCIIIIIINSFLRKHAINLSVVDHGFVTVLYKVFFELINGYLNTGDEEEFSIDVVRN